MYDCYAPVTAGGYDGAAVCFVKHQCVLVLWTGRCQPYLYSDLDVSCSPLDCCCTAHSPILSLSPSDTLFVRAARKTGAGSELTVSYLPVGGGGDAAAAEADGGDAGGGEAADGDGGGGPAAAAAAAPEAYSSATLLSALDDRRAALEEARGFTCRCSRCRAEEKLVSVW